MSIRDQIHQIEELRDKARTGRDRALAAAERYSKEMTEYDTAIAVLEKIAPPDPDRINLAQRIQAASIPQGQGPIWKRILDVLTGSDQVWWTANEIQDELAKQGDAVKMTSISPNLTRLKEAGEIVRDDLKVALAVRAPQNTEAPEDDLLGRNSPEASDDTRLNQSSEPPAQGRKAVPGGGT